MNTQLRNIKIAQFLNLPSSYSIRRVDEFQHVYLVIKVVGRPVFVSKAAIDKPQPQPSSDQQPVRCKVLAVTKPRPNRFAGTLNQGVLLMSLKDREQFWIRHYQYQSVPVYRGDMVKFDAKYQAISKTK